MLKFKVRGSSGDAYEILALREGDNFRMSCTCEAGRQGTYCKHRFALLDGDVSNLLSHNSDDVTKLVGLISGTDVDRRYKVVRELTAQKVNIELKLRLEKKALAREMNS